MLKYFLKYYFIFYSVVEILLTYDLQKIGTNRIKKKKINK